MADSQVVVPFQKIPEACKTTGLSQYFLRKGCKDGTIPHVRSGSTYYINVPELLRQLSAEEHTKEVINILATGRRNMP